MTPEPDRSDDATSDEAARRSYDGDVSALERRLADRGEAYARVTVVRREPPVSANVGDRGVVTADGELHGWVGGTACAQSHVSSAGRAAIADGEPRLVGIAPDPADVDRPGVETFPMTCHSEGVLELFVEPVGQQPRLLIVGGSPVARSLARLAAELALEVTIVDPAGTGDGNSSGSGALPAGATVLETTEPDAIVDAVGAQPIVVIASMGEFDAGGVAAAVRCEAPYVGLVASDTRASEVIGLSADLLDEPAEAVEERVTNPAGVDIEAYTPAEIAVSLLAEVVDARAKAGPVTRSAATGGAESDASRSDADGTDGTGSDTAGEGDVDGTADTATSATDPVCGMSVDPDDAAASVDHGGETYYFCCRGCADAFRTDPAEHVDADEGGPTTPR